MRYPPERREAHLANIRAWAADGLDRAAILDRLAAQGVERSYRYQLTKEANDRYDLGWAIRDLATAHKVKARGLDMLIACRAKGMRRKDAVREVAEALGMSERAVLEWVHRNRLSWGRVKAPPVARPYPSSVQDLVRRILHDLRHEDAPDAEPCRYPSGGRGSKDAFRWGVAVAYGNPAVIFLVHDYDDFRRQYNAEARRELRAAGD